jgi:O-methyltransferase involved in polyketide biosynthesis
MQLMHRIAVQVGEPMKSGFDPRALAVELRELGFDLVENVSPEEIQARYFTGRQDAYRAFEHVHFARAAVGRF